MLVRRLVETEQRLLELTGGQVDSFLDPTGRSYLVRQVQEKLRQSETTQTSILNALPANIALIDSEGVIVAVNEGWCKFAGDNALQNSAAGLGQNYLKICEGGDDDRAQEAHKVAAGIRSVLNGTAKNFELEYPCHSPTEQRWFRLLVTPLDETRAAGAVVMHLNITERKQMEVELRESESRHRSLFENMVEGYAYCRAVYEQGRVVDIIFLDVNKAYEPLTGLKNVVGKKVSELIPGIRETNPELFERYARVIATGQSERYESYVKALGKWFSITIYSYEKDHFVGVFDNITERKRTEECLRESEERFSGAFTYAPIGMALASPEGRWLKVNRALCELTGYSETELLAKSFQEITHPDDLPADFESMRQMLAGKIPNYQTDKRYIHKRGTVVHVSLHVSLVRDGHGRPLQFVAQIRDITDAERSQARLRRLVDSNAQAVFFWNTKGEITDGNDAFLKITGYTRADLEARRINWAAMTPLEYNDRDQLALKELAATGICAPYEKEWIRKDGRLVPILLGAAMFEDNREEGIMFALDLTERKRAEQFLRESEERFSGAFLHAPIGVALVSPEGRWLKVNRALCALVGYSEIELLAGTFQDITHPEDLQTDLGYMHQTLAGEIPGYQMEKRYLHKRGHFITILLNVSLVRDRRNQPLYFIAQIQDITERKQALDALHESEDKFSKVFHSSPVGIALSTADEGRYLDANEAFLKMLQLSRDEVIGHTALELDVWVNMEQRGAAVAKIKDQGAAHNLEMKVHGREGKVTDILWSANTVVIGGKKYLLGLSRDITDWKRSQARLRRLVDSNAQGVIFCNFQGEITEANDAFLQITGYTREDFQAGGLNWPALTPPEYADLDRRGLAEITATGICTPFKKEYIRKDGSRVPVLVGAAAFQDNPREGVCFVLDLTTQAQSERELSRMNRALQMLSAGNERLIRAEDEQALLNQICQVAVENGGYLMVWVGYMQDDQYSSIRPVAHAGKDDGYLSWIKLSWSEQDAIGRGPAGKTARNSQATVCADIKNDASFDPWRTEAQKRGYQGVICLPLRVDNRTFGLLGLYSGKVEPADENEVRLLQQLADNLAFGILTLRNRKERQQADAKIREQAALLDAASDAIILKDLGDRIVFWNRGAEQIYGWSAAEAVGKKSCDLLSIDRNQFHEALKLLMEKNHWRGELQKKTKDGRLLAIEARWTVVCDAEGKPKSVLAINTDITERKKLELQFLRMQRMESIGTLAGGIAHDLNNMLSPIIMSIDILQEKIQDEEGRAVLDTLQASAQRSANLIKQVLSFARGVEGQRILVNPINILRELQKIIQETFPKNIQINFNLGRDIWTVTGDPTQLHQVLMNLCVNARDAMPDGGKLTIDTKNVVLDEVYAKMNPESKPGSYVRIEVADSGVGIPQDIQDKIFEPFFTTKNTGKGTGLGLSTTQAIVRSHEGFINLYSEMGKGTVFTVYLPAKNMAKETATTTTEALQHPRGHGELVLVIDDEESILASVGKILERFGYRVLTAKNGAEAVSLYARRGDEIDVVLTDMAMPVMDGPSTIIALKIMNPKVKVIGSSGHATSEGVAKAVGAGVKHFIPKPYTAGAILNVIAALIKD